MAASAVRGGGPTVIAPPTTANRELAGISVVPMPTLPPWEFKIMAWPS